MPRQYSKQIGSAALKKWEVDPTIIDVLSDCGNWGKTWDDKLHLLNIANLTLYYTGRLTAENPSLPNVDTLAAFQKIPEKMRVCTKDNWLDLITDNNDDIETIISTFK